uniref:Uncharacterized protein n=1 Tax=Anguilla anguilla TaxID=7936 RepID=A0A0E9SMC2_ANGAN
MSWISPVPLTDLPHTVLSLTHTLTFKFCFISH